MAHIDIYRSHSLGTEELARRVRELEGNVLAQYGIRIDWNSKPISLQGRGFKGEAVLGEDNLSLSLTLNMLLRPMTGKIKQAIEDHIDKSLQET